MTIKLNEYGEEVPNPIPTTSKLSIVVNRDLYKEFKLKTVMNGESITEAVTNMLKEYINR